MNYIQIEQRQQIRIKLFMFQNIYIQLKLVIVDTFLVIQV